ncbi:MAG TPA: organomercurial lyase [Candidatus Bathyarchaeia archaeon]|nr:organomercurial lyase [Candidatus Bathyarchaeia archaeon]
MNLLSKLLIVAALIAAVVGIKVWKDYTTGDPTQLIVKADQGPAAAPAAQDAPKPAAPKPQVLPRLVDLGADKCIPCKMMAPILEELKKEYAGRFDVEFIDVWKNPPAAKEYGIRSIPTQVFFDASGKELFRHVGFFGKDEILGKWREFGVLPAEQKTAPPAGFTRLEPASADTRDKNQICYMCDGDIAAKTLVVLKTEKGDVNFCSPHCYFIAYSSMMESKPPIENVSVTDWNTGSLVAAGSARFALSLDQHTRPVVKAFADEAAAKAECSANGGSVIDMPGLMAKEMETRCGFCDRAVYPADACAVKVEGLNTWGCCTMCALGVAARLQKDIEVTAKDALSGEPIQVKTAGGHVSSLEPQSAVAWAGTKKDAEGKLVSTGCFKQAFFAHEANLRKWVDVHPTATGRLILIEQALVEKMKLTPQQISKACKIGECTPK